MKTILKIYGPYQHENGRLFVVAKYSDGSKGSISYPKYLMELHLGRKLLPNETVDHIDRNYLNNEISNLQILDRSLHVKLDVKRRQDEILTCIWCNANFLKTGKILSTQNSRIKHTAGPFCSKKCSGKYGASILHDGIEPLARVQNPKNYYQLDKSSVV
jgi:hypothetical protein